MKIKKFIDRKIVVSGLAIALGAALFFAALSNLNHISKYIKVIRSYIAPVTGGLALAYVLRPLAKFIETKLLKKMRSEKARVHIAGISTVLLFLVIIYFFIKTLIPQLLSSVTSFVTNIDSYIATAKSTILYYADKYESLNIDVNKLIGSSDDILHTVSGWLSENIGQMMSLATHLGSQILNMVIILAMSIYALLDRKNLKKGVVRLELVLLGEEKANWVNKVVGRGDTLMMKFLGSNLLDALIIGVVNFIFLRIFNAPYAVLLSVMLGIFNFVPTFGPIFGGIIGALIMLLTQPSLFIGFVIFTVVLQQIDGNVIKPVLFGDSTGISPFWVLVAIVVGGNMFGVLGMILGVPLFALITSIYSEIIDKLLIKRKEKEKKAAQENSPEAEPPSPPEAPAAEKELPDAFPDETEPAEENAQAAP